MFLLIINIVLFIFINIVLFTFINIEFRFNYDYLQYYIGYIIIGIFVNTPILMLTMFISISNNFFLILFNYIYIYILFPRICFIEEYKGVSSYFLVAFLPASIQVIENMENHIDLLKYISCLFVLLVFNIYVIFSDYFSPLKYLFASKSK